MSRAGKHLPVRIELGAKAEAKLNVRAKVPEKSAGRLVDALTDLIRPFSESRGLRADHIRLQREEVAIEIAKRARARLAVEKAKIEPIKNKVLVPLIEGASNEELSDDYMIDMWSNLLAAAATNQKVEPRFIGILRELQGKQAKVFERLALNNAAEFERPLAHLEDAPSVLEPAWLRQSLTNLFSSKRTSPDIPEIYATLMGGLNGQGQQSST
jgi:hypothetical protein